MRRDLTIIIVVALASCLAYGHAGQPLHGDRAYHVYMAQSALRGDALYGQTTYGYTPYTPLLTALVMRALAPFGVPTYLAPRYLGVVLFVLLAVMLYFLARRASDARTALIASVTLCGFGHLALLSVVGTEPVTLVAVLTLGATLALQRTWWFAAGVAAGAAAMSWQPAIVVCLAVLVLARRRLPVIAGACVAALPAMTYVLPVFDDFVYQAILRKASSAEVSLGATWLLIGVRAYWTDALVLLAGAAGFIVAARRHTSENLPLLALTLAWIAWFAIYFGAVKDLIPALPFIAYWAARTVARRSVPVLILYLAVLFGDALLYRPAYTLSNQIRDVRAALEPISGDFIAFGAEEFYILTETRAPLRYIRLGRWVDEFIEARDPGGVAAFPRKIAALDPSVLVIADDEGPSRAREALEPLLRDLPRTVVRTPYLYAVDTPLMATEMQPAVVYRRIRTE